MTSPTQASVAANYRDQGKHYDNYPEHDGLQKVKQHVASACVKVVFVS